MSRTSDPIEQFSVALVGFSAFERAALASFFRLALQRSPAFEQVEEPDLADFLVADADRPRSLQTVLEGGRLPDTVFVGAQAPEGAMAWLPRPIDPVHIVRELDALVERRQSAAIVPPLPERREEVDVLLNDMGPLAGGSDGPAEDRWERRGGAGRDVLVVEDSAIARKFLAQRLHRLGYRVHLAHDGEQAAQMLALRPYAVVFVDIVLGAPGSIDGLQICHSIKLGAAHPDGPPPAVVIVTGLTGSADRVRGSLAGCDAYLTKPLVEREFVATLAEVDPGFESLRA
jgi:two-component system, cell cycle response regulator